MVHCMRNANIYCVRRNKCGLFNNKHNGMASVKNVVLVVRFR